MNPRLTERDVAVARLAHNALGMKEIARRLGLTPEQIRHSLRKQNLSVRRIKGAALPRPLNIAERWKQLGPQMLAEFRENLVAMGFKPGKRVDQDFVL